LPEAKTWQLLGQPPARPGLQGLQGAGHGKSAAKQARHKPLVNKPLGWQR